MHICSIYIYNYAYYVRVKIGGGDIGGFRREELQDVYLGKWKIVEIDVVI